MCAPQKMENKHFFKLCGNTEIEEIICQLCYHDGIVPVFLFDYDWWKYNVQLNVAKRKHKTDFLHISKKVSSDLLPIAKCIFHTQIIP